MKYKLLLSFGVLLLAGVILVPISVFYLKDTMPFMIVASCITGFLAYLYFSDKTEVNSTQIASNDLIGSSLSDISKKITNLQDVLSAVHKNEELIKESTSKSINEMANILKDAISEQTLELQKSKEELKSGLKDFNDKWIKDFSTQTSSMVNRQEILIDLLTKINNTGKENLADIANNNQLVLTSVKSVATSLSQIAAQQESIIKKVEVSITNGNTAVVSTLSQIITIIDETTSVTQQSVDEIIRHREQMVQSSHSLYDGIAQLIQQQKIVETSISNMEETMHNSMKYLEETRNITNDSAKNLSSSVEKFLSDHDDIQKTLDATANRIIDLQQNLERIFENQSDRVNGILQKFTDNFDLNTNKLQKKLGNSADDIKDSLSTSIKKIDERLTDLMDKVGDYTSIISDYMDDLSKDIKLHDDKLSKLCHYIPKLHDLNSSEEQMMRELEKICRVKR